MEKVIEVKKLVKNYGKLKAVNEISFEVKKGEIFGLLGENGAGKTTTLEIIEGLRKATSGNISMLGHDISNGITDNVKTLIGVQLQASAYYQFLNLKEILELFGSFYNMDIDAMKLLSSVGLQDKAKSLIKALSGGQKQRFSIVASLVNNPEIVFLDEPTTGLDPLARRRLWELIANIKAEGKTVVLTTHYMEEAEVLCDRVAIMEKGKILVMGDTHKLIEKTKNPYRVSFYSTKVDSRAAEKLNKLGNLVNLLGKSNHFEMKITSQANLNKALLIIHGTSPESLDVGRASLEDLFIELTGKTIGEKNA